MAPYCATFLAICLAGYLASGSRTLVIQSASPSAYRNCALLSCFLLFLLFLSPSPLSRTGFSYFFRMYSPDFTFSYPCAVAVAVAFTVAVPSFMPRVSEDSSPISRLGGVELSSCLSANLGREGVHK